MGENLPQTLSNTPRGSPTPQRDIHASQGLEAHGPPYKQTQSWPGYSSPQDQHPGCCRHRGPDEHPQSCHPQVPGIQPRHTHTKVQARVVSGSQLDVRGDIFLLVRSLDPSNLRYALRDTAAYAPPQFKHNTPRTMLSCIDESPCRTIRSQTKEKISRLQVSLITRCRVSAYNICETQTLPMMRGSPSPISKPIACYTPRHSMIIEPRTINQEVKPQLFYATPDDLLKRTNSTTPPLPPVHPTDLPDIANIATSYCGPTSWVLEPISSKTLSHTVRAKHLSKLHTEANDL